ncbi:MAG TPA: hypothetical protein DCS29_03330 [Candidatus Magasanikbacteria bacterium]|nr:MAG: hypothetical protein A2479_01430 [Candidatus Magasanikbacteria bacterium RIFOXYC2_FULL_39_8]HAT03778.1 hypothetical protein [Candidatus Magasanikbacteria bacterium]
MFECGRPARHRTLGRELDAPAGVGSQSNAALVERAENLDSQLDVPLVVHDELDALHGPEGVVAGVEDLEVVRGPCHEDDGLGDEEAQSMGG